MATEIEAAGGVRKLTVAALRNRCDPTMLKAPLDQAPPAMTEPIGQERGLEALAFGLRMNAKGFNVYVSGCPGTGKTTAVRSLLEQIAPGRATPSEWCYVHNHGDPSRPRALHFPAGGGRHLRDSLRSLVVEARRKIPRAFETDEYVARREAIMTEFNRRRDGGMQELATRAERGGFALQPGPTGLSLIPTMGNRPLSDEDVAGLRPEMRDTIEQTRADLEARVRTFMQGMTSAERTTRGQLEAQDREIALHAVSSVMDVLLEDFAGQPEVLAYLEDVREEILADISLFRSHPLPADGSLPPAPDEGSPEHALHARALRKYEVNLIVYHAGDSGAPVVYETNPSYPNLLGRIEREAVFGALMTDLTLISAGALHRANGGYLLLRLADLARSPLSWEGLKRCLRENLIDLEDIGEAYGVTGARGLRPEPIPLDLKVVLVGDAAQFAALSQMDPEFGVHFKVRADFDSQIDRGAEQEIAYAAFLRWVASESGCALDAAAAALLVEESSRLADDQQKLSARLGAVSDLVCESAFWARSAQRPAILGDDVRRAVESRRQRGMLVAGRFREMIRRGVLLVQLEGTAVGQLNGLAVVSAGDATFGHPSRITATISPGTEGILDIERVVALGGPIHSKGVLILSGYLADVYAQDKPLAFAARLVFEQSYGGVEGDSASLAELLALLSRIADLPLRQDLAVTGSINQRGEVQAVGGVNEKIEGFFDVCRDRGLTGTQGALLPASNISNLMLREDVLEAVAAGKFHIYAVSTVDEALSLLTGVEVGQRGADGRWPVGTLHGRVDARLTELAQIVRTFSNSPGPSRRAARGGRS